VGSGERWYLVWRHLTSIRRKRRWGLEVRYMERILERVEVIMWVVFALFCIGRLLACSEASTSRIRVCTMSIQYPSREHRCQRLSAIWKMLALEAAAAAHQRKLKLKSYDRSLRVKFEAITQESTYLHSIKLQKAANFQRWEPMHTWMKGDPPQVVGVRPTSPRLDRAGPQQGQVRRRVKPGIESLLYCRRQALGVSACALIAPLIYNTLYRHISYLSHWQSPLLF
jgi:hypothetical protein